MSHVDNPHAARRSKYIPALGWMVLILAYMLIFRAFGEETIGPALQRAVINVLPAIVLSFPVLHVVETYAVDRPLFQQTAIHLVGAVLFGVAWLIGIQAGYGLRDGWLTEGITGRPLLGVALTWQLFQGLIVYAVIALYGYMRNYQLRLMRAEEDISRLRSDTPETAPQASQLLVKDGRTFKPIPISDIIAISGAGDYCDVVTPTQIFASRTALSQFESILPDSIFMRVHRSHIVRVDAILSVESAGNGKLTLHLLGGNSVVTSRTGAKLIKSHAV